MQAARADANDSPWRFPAMTDLLLTGRLLLVPWRFIRIRRCGSMTEVQDRHALVILSVKQANAYVVTGVGHGRELPRVPRSAERQARAPVRNPPPDRTRPLGGPVSRRV